MTEPLDETPDLGYANMWWGITPSALRGMLAYSRFEVEEWLLTSSRRSVSPALAARIV